MSKTILITGANGFLGSSITKIALKKKYKVKVLVRKKSDLVNLTNLKVEICYGDLRDIDSLKGPVDKCDVIFHVAADYRLWAKRKTEIYESNVFGTENLLKTACSIKNLKFIHTSSVATLGLKRDGVSNENTQVSFSDMIGDYKKSKFISEQIFLDYVRNKKLDGLVVNPSTPIGPGDIKPTPTGRIILQTLLKKMPAYVDTGLNIVHVDDVALGHFLALDKGKVGEKYILGGENLLLKDFLEIIAEISNISPPKFNINTKPLYFFAYLNEFIAKLIRSYDPMLTIDGLRMSEKKMFFSSEKAKKNLGYRPRNVKNAIKDSVNWMKDNFIKT